MLLDLPSHHCQHFTRALASSSPVPGGGGAAALCGALGACLGSMAASIRLARSDRESPAGQRLQRLCSQCEQLRQDYLERMDKDALAFLPLQKAYSLPKDKPGREEILYRASLEAAQPPMEMLEAGGRLVDLLEQLEFVAGKLLLSDVGCAASLAAAALETAAFNVFVNTAPFRDREEGALLHERAQRILSEQLPRAQALSRRLLDSLKGE